MRKVEQRLELCTVEEQMGTTFKTGDNVALIGVVGSVRRVLNFDTNSTNVVLPLVPKSER